MALNRNKRFVQYESKGLTHFNPYGFRLRLANTMKKICITNGEVMEGLKANSPCPPGDKQTGYDNKQNHHLDIVLM